MSRTRLPALLLCGGLASLAGADQAPALALNCDEWINLGEGFAQEVGDPVLADWLAARDLTCDGIERFIFPDSASARRDGCLLLELDPTHAMQLHNVICD